MAKDMLALELSGFSKHPIEQVYLPQINLLKRVEQDDNDIAVSIQKGDIMAFESVFKAHYKPLCSYAMAMLKDIDQADEVVQQVFCKIWERRSSLQITSSVKAYLYRSVRNDCLNQIKHTKIKEQYIKHSTDHLNRSSDSASHKLLGRELEIKIQEAIDELPEQCAVIFRLSRFEELKYKEIAEQLSISIKTVENQMGKALKLLRVKLAEYISLAVIFILLNS
ncbi:MAG TPA: RNA polymerase sigma-70 factor [Bacteroidia bacterium]|jgi:RNA polymerase sigma-70 factor (family 1)|nr:RNA polymerase sigma-70 factor [Bacteroidia bacterium]